MEEQLDIWAPILADPLPSPSWLPYMECGITGWFYEEEEAHATMALGGGGGEEEEMGEEGGAKYPLPSHLSSMRLAPTATQPEEGSCNLLDYIPKCGWRHESRVRSERKKGTWSLNTELCFHNLHSEGEGQQCGHRRNNDHWNSDEMKKLVDGVSVYGVGYWTKLKKERFSTSVRTALHLKDKWRNLVKAYTGNAKGKTLYPLDKDSVKKIWRLAVRYPRK